MENEGRKRIDKCHIIGDLDEKLHQDPTTYQFQHNSIVPKFELSMFDDLLGILSLFFLLLHLQVLLCLHLYDNRFLFFSKFFYSVVVCSVRLRKEDWIMPMPPLPHPYMYIFAVVRDLKSLNKIVRF